MSVRTFLVAVAVTLALAVAILAWPRHSTPTTPYHASATLTPGVLNPDVMQATIGSTICTHGWTRTIRPPTEYTTRLKIEQRASTASAARSPPTRRTT